MFILCRCWLPLCLVLLGVSLSHSTIVWDNQAVSAWPAQAVPDAPSPSQGSAAQGLAKVSVHTGDMGFYPQPTGVILGLTLLVDFSDEPALFTVQEINDWLNKPGFNRDNCNGSVRDYFLEVSNGAVDYQNQVFGYYRAQHPKSYYDGGNDYERASELRQEVIDYFDPIVDFSQYDNDGDGYTDAVSIAYAGSGVTWGRGIWPHSGWIGQRRDNVTINRYMMTDIRTSFSLYVFAHESGHMIFAWPDLYWFGDYCLMGNRMSDKNPTPINDFFRADQGWIPIVTIDSTTRQSFMVAPGDTAYRFLNPADTMEGFLWTYTTNQGRYSSLRSSGLLAYHFNRNTQGNTSANSLHLRVVQADGSTSLQHQQWPNPGSNASDFFNTPSYTDFSYPLHSQARWDNGANSAIVLRNIMVQNDSLFFTAGTEPPVHTLQQATVPSPPTILYFANPMGQVKPLPLEHKQPFSPFPLYPVYKMHPAH